MYYWIHKFIFIAQICSVIIALAHITTGDDLQNLQNHRNGILNLKDVADHWIGYPKSPYTSFSVTVNPKVTPQTTAPTSAPTKPRKTNTKKKKKKHHPKTPNNKRRSDINDEDDYSDYTETQRGRGEKSPFPDFEYDYDGPLDSIYGKTYGPSPYIFRSAPSSPKTVVVNPSVSASSKSLKAIYAGTPKVATYVVPSAKKYVVQKVKSQMVYAPPALVPPNHGMYAAASNSGMRRLDPMDYEDTGGSFPNQGPQDGFPPKPVLDKITEAGQRQPCHGPDCHQHHKGLVRFYWRRVVYPRNARGRVRGRARARRPQRGRNRRRRLRNRGRAPSDQREVYYNIDDEDAEESEDGTNVQNNEEDDDEDEDEDNEEIDTSRRNVWQPGKAYGHDLNEGTNYDDQDRRVYRDKRYTTRSSRKRNRGSF